jgi:hypothetical protein
MFTVILYLDLFSLYTHDLTQMYKLITMGA